MSSALAIAATARILAQLIGNRVAAEGLTVFQGFKTSVVSPEQIDGTDLVANLKVAPQVNIFAYHVGLNAAYRNAFEPSRNLAAQPVTSPPLAIDVSFLVSAHGTDDLVPEILIGLAMQALSDNPQLTRDRVTTLLQLPAGPPDPVLQAISQSQLANQFEIIRIVPLNLSADDMQKLWTSVHSRYRPSFCYMVSGLLIDTQNQAKTGLPVRSFATSVIQFIRPLIDHIEPASLPFTPAGSQIALVGQQLLQPGAVARFSTGDRQPLNSGSNMLRALVTLPADLPAGIIGVEIVRPMNIGAPPPKDVNESNLAVFVYSPIFNLTAANLPDIALAAPSGTPPVSILQVRLQPPAQPGQDVRVLLNQKAVSSTSSGFDFPGTLGANPATDPISFSLTGIPTGTYMVRVRVDGADTPLELDATGAYSGPTIAVP